MLKLGGLTMAKAFAANSIQYHPGNGYRKYSLKGQFGYHYVGYFNDRARHAQGIYTHANGSILHEGH